MENLFSKQMQNMTFIMYFSLLPPYLWCIQKGNSPPPITGAKH